MTRRNLNQSQAGFLGLWASYIPSTNFKSDTRICEGVAREVACFTEIIYFEFSNVNHCGKLEDMCVSFEFEPGH